MNTPCSNARGLIPSYLDGEVSEEQASPLRRHLLECPSCREVAKQETVLKRWFVDGPASEVCPVPPGFAARVARRALAGDPGVPELVPAALSGAPAATEISITPFVQVLTAAAAVLVIAFAAGIRSHELPRSHGLEAQEDLGEIVRQLDVQNRAEERRLLESAADETADDDELER